MDYSYNIEGKDLVHLNFYFMDQEELGKARRSLKLSPLIFVVVIIGARFLSRGIDIPFVLISLGAYMIWFFISDKILDKMSERRMNKAINTEENKWLTNTRTMHLDDETIGESIVLDNGENKELFRKPYGELHTVEVSEHGLYIFIDEVSAFIMPRRTFGSEEEMKKTYNFIINKKNKDKNVDRSE